MPHNHKYKPKNLPSYMHHACNPITKTGLNLLHAVSYHLDEAGIPHALSGGAGVFLMVAEKKLDNLRGKELNSQLKTFSKFARESDFDWYVAAEPELAVVKLQGPLGGIRKEKHNRGYVEVLFSRDPVMQFAQADENSYQIRNRRKVEIDKYEIAVAPPEFIFAFKSIRADPIDPYDNALLVQAGLVDSEKLRKAVEEYAPKKVELVLGKYHSFIDHLTKDYKGI